MSTTIIKEFTSMPTGVRVQLVQGWDGDRPTYYSVDVKSGLNLPANNPNHGVIESQVLACTVENYAFAAKRFAERIKPYL